MVLPAQVPSCWNHILERSNCAVWLKGCDSGSFSFPEPCSDFMLLVLSCSVQAFTFMGWEHFHFDIVLICRPFCDNYSHCLCSIWYLSILNSCLFSGLWSHFIYIFISSRHGVNYYKASVTITIPITFNFPPLHYYYNITWSSITITVTITFVHDINHFSQHVAVLRSILVSEYMWQFFFSLFFLSWHFCNRK